MSVLHDGTDNRFCAVIFPILAVHIPLYHIITAVFCYFHNRVVIIAMGRPEQKHFISGQRLYLIMYTLNFLFFFRIRQPAHIQVAFTMVSQVMTRRQNCLCLLRICLHPLSGHKERNMHLLLLQNPQNFHDITISPCGLKSQCKLWLSRFHAVNRQFPVSHVRACQNPHRIAVKKSSPCQ